jgi:hypothetical protein
MDSSEQLKFHRKHEYASPVARDHSVACALPLYLLLWTAWVALSAWCIAVVGGGIESVQLYPATLPDWAPYAFAAAIQVVTSYFAWGVVLIMGEHRAKRRAWIVKIGAVIVVSVVTVMAVGFEISHAVLAQIKNSQGRDLLAREATELAEMNVQITTVSKQVESLYQAKLRSFQELAEAAKAGMDRTGDARCGAICAENWDRFHRAKAKYNDLAVIALDMPPPSDNLRQTFSATKNRLDMLAGLKARLVEFYSDLDQSAPPATISVAIERLQADLDQRLARYEGMSQINANALAMEQTWDVLRRVVHGEPISPISMLSVGYGILPFALLVALAIYLRHVAAHRRQDYVGALETEVVEEQQAQEFLQRLRKLREANFKNWVQAKYRDWRKFRETATV